MTIVSNPGEPASLVYDPILSPVAVRYGAFPWLTRGDIVQSKQTYVRLTPSDQLMLKAIQDRMGLPSLAAAIRHSAVIAHEVIFPKVKEKTNGKR